MAIIEWKECYATGVGQFDTEHQELVSKINSLYEAIRSKETEKQLPELLDGLIQYTEEHFNHEEEQLKSLEYPELETHQQEHNDLRQKVADFKQRLDSGEEQLPLKLLNFLREWLLHHIVEVDQGYGDFLNEKGVK